MTALSQLRAAATAMAANFNVKYDRRRFVIAFITVPAALIEQMHEKCKMRANGWAMQDNGRACSARLGENGARCPNLQILYLGLIPMMKQ